MYKFLSIVSLLYCSFSFTVFSLPKEIATFIEKHCVDCHDAEMKEGELDLEVLSFDLKSEKNFEHWFDIYDRVLSGEMPPKKKKRPAKEDMEHFLAFVKKGLMEEDLKHVQKSGRSEIRRLNRFEYENSVRQLLDAPWLRIREHLPEDGTAHLFNKVGGNLDVSHVQIEAYLSVAERAIDKALSAAAYPTKVKKYYARDEKGMTRNFWYRFGQHSATRATIPLLGTKAQPEVIRKEAPISVGKKNPQIREQEAVGVVCGTYTATTKYDFKNVKIPTDGKYRLRIKSYTFMAGPNGRSGGDDHGLVTGRQEWWRPDRNVAFPSNRTEPITIYALKSSGDSRWAFTYDAKPKAEVFEKEIFLEQGEAIRPDAGRLVRTRPGWGGNANATKEGIPGYALNWLEVKGPIHEQWPPKSYQALFGKMPFKIDKEKNVEVISEYPEKDAERLLLSFMRRAYRRPVQGVEVKPYLGIYHKAREAGESFTSSMKSAYMSLMCSPGFIYLEEKEGNLDSYALASRLSYFLWNGPPDTELRDKAASNKLNLNEQTERLLKDSRSERFVNSFLDYWLNLRELQSNPPDASLYPDYYLDDQLTEASLLETRMFFTSLIKENRPVKDMISPDYTFLNERLGNHYGIPVGEGVQLKRVKIPKGSPRGGLLSQASVLRVTANGTTTSPVIRGAWIAERILGIHIPAPPSGVEAIEPDTRGATTIREQLKKHNSDKSCRSCHAKFDPVGFSLENFDVAGGWQTKYRSLGKEGKKAKGIGKNGHTFKFRYNQEVDAAGELKDGRKFSNIVELKKMLVENERQLARNLVNRFIVYSTGEAVRFSDREAVENILNKTAANKYRIKDLIKEVVNSKIFTRK